MAIDLHSHSRYSDGSDTPAEIVATARAKGLTALALTDHDLLDGLDEARAAAGDEIEFVPGTELSVDWHEMGMHLLVYWIGPDTPLADRLDEIQQGRSDRNIEMVATLNDMGIDITIEQLQEEAGVGVIGRPHFAAILVRAGVVDSIGAAFDQYLAAGRPAYRPRIRLDAAEAVRLAWESEAVPVVAHPHTLADGSQEFTHVLPELAELGIAGIESHYVEYTPDLRLDLARRVTDLGLVATGGSDYHGTYKPGIDLGTGKGDLSVPESCLEQLAARRS